MAGGQPALNAARSGVINRAMASLHAPARPALPPCTIRTTCALIVTATRMATEYHAAKHIHTGQAAKEFPIWQPSECRQPDVQSLLTDQRPSRNT